MMEQEFEWDQNKNNANIEKHGVDFNYIIKIFAIYRIYEQDIRKDYGEARYNTTGELEGRVYTISYTLREENIRIISARKAHENERRKYYQTKFKRLESGKN
jgi:hypothetical protein